MTVSAANCLHFLALEHGSIDENVEITSL